MSLTTKKSWLPIVKSWTLGLGLLTVLGSTAWRKLADPEKNAENILALQQIQAESELQKPLRGLASVPKEAASLKIAGKAHAPIAIEIATATGLADSPEATTYLEASIESRNDEIIAGSYRWRLPQGVVLKEGLITDQVELSPSFPKARIRLAVEGLSTRESKNVVLDFNGLKSGEAFGATAIYATRPTQTDLSNQADLSNRPETASTRDFTSKATSSSRPEPPPGVHF
jgi:hypothetical protein